MVHELLGIKDNKVDIGNVGKFSKDQQVSFHFFIWNYQYLLEIHVILNH